MIEILVSKENLLKIINEIDLTPDSLASLLNQDLSKEVVETILKKLYDASLSGFVYTSAANISNIGDFAEHIGLWLLKTSFEQDGEVAYIKKYDPPKSHIEFFENLPNRVKSDLLGEPATAWLADYITANFECDIDDDLFICSQIEDFEGYFTIQATGDIHTMGRGLTKIPSNEILAADLHSVLGKFSEVFNKLLAQHKKTVWDYIVANRGLDSQGYFINSWELAVFNAPNLEFLTKNIDGVDYAIDVISDYDFSKSYVDKFVSFPNLIIPDVDCIDDYTKSYPETAFKKWQESQKDVIESELELLKSAAFNLNYKAGKIVEISHNFYQGFVARISSRDGKQVSSNFYFNKYNSFDDCVTYLKKNL